MENCKHKIKVVVNGLEREASVESRLLLTDFLREDLELTGTHLGCEHGVCGACTVIVNGKSVRSCLMFAVQADGAEILTVEGLAEKDKLHPIQQAFHECHGLQCGFCTPGILMTTYDFLKENPSPNEEEIKEALSGNLCRCTGYVNIVKSVKDASEKMQKENIELTK